MCQPRAGSVANTRLLAVVELVVIGDLYIRLDAAAAEACLPADATHRGVHVLLFVAQRRGAGVALGIAVQLHLLPDHRSHWTVAEGPLRAELIASVQCWGQIAALWGTGVLTGGRTQVDLAGYVVAQPAVADLAIDPGALPIPASEQGWYRTG